MPRGCGAIIHCFYPAPTGQQMFISSTKIHRFTYPKIGLKTFFTNIELETHSCFQSVSDDEEKRGPKSDIPDLIGLGCQQQAASNGPITCITVSASLPLQRRPKLRSPGNRDGNSNEETRRKQGEKKAETITNAHAVPPPNKGQCLLQTLL